MTAAVPAFQCLALNEAASYWRERIRAAESLALFLDFDGTLSPIAAKPELAAIDPQIKNTLEHLRDLSGVHIAIISGRQLSDVRERAGIDGITYAGNHGLEIETDTLCFREPRAESMRLELRRLVLRLEVLLAETTGIEIEEKGLSVAVHYRQVHETLHDWVRGSVAETVCRSQAFSYICGKMVVDIRPKVEWNKGSAVKWILERFSSQVPYPVLMGDDATDEDAFSALAGQALTIHVGEPKKTSARFWIPDVCAVRAFLSEVYELRSTDRRH
jgi:trehalose 6-phosphate phosphatase